MIANDFLFQSRAFVDAIELIEEEIGRKIYDGSNRSNWIRFTNNHVFMYGVGESSADLLLKRFESEKVLDLISR